MTTLRMTEAELQATIIDAAHMFGWLVHHVKPARTPDGKWLTRIQGDPGFPDLVLARPGRILFVEVKSDQGRMRPDQRSWFDCLGDNAHVWRPDDWQSGRIVEWLR